MRRSCEACKQHVASRMRLVFLSHAHHTHFGSMQGANGRSSVLNVALPIE